MLIRSPHDCERNNESFFLTGSTQSGYRNRTIECTDRNSCSGMGAHHRAVLAPSLLAYIGLRVATRAIVIEQQEICPTPRRSRGCPSDRAGAPSSGQSRSPTCIVAEFLTSATPHLHLATPLTSIRRAIGWPASPKLQTELRRAGRPRGCPDSARF